jgi:hypothetical protein
MPKQKTTIRFDPEDLQFAQEVGIKISEVCREALEIEIDAWCESLETETGETRSRAKARALKKKIVAEYLQKRGSEKAQELRDMRAHIKAAKAAGKTRGEAETDWNKGTMFPDRLWNEA